MIFVRTLLILTLGCSLAARAGEPPAAAWQAGVATKQITPKVPMWMGGYAARTHPSTGTAQDLFMKALALEDAQRGRFVFITLDAIGIPRSVRKNLERRLGASFQLRPEQFVITASHTHSGPEFRAGRVPEDGRGSVENSRAYLASLEETAHALVGEALGALAPAKLSYVRARAGFAMNRRLPQPNAEPRNSANSDGPVDHDVPVLRVEDAAGKLRALLFGYACHNTTLTQASYVFCGDYAGFAQHYLQEDHPGVTALFMTGCGGDQNPYPRSMLELARVHGRTLATAVEAALVTKPKPISGPLRSRYGEIDLRYAAVPTKAELESLLKAKDAQESGHAQRMLDRLAQEGSLPGTYPYPVQVLHFGDDLKLIALGGEAVVDYSLQLKRELGGSNQVWVAAYSNDVLGYIPTERVLRERGYEGASASRIGSLHPSPWAPGLEKQIVDKVMELDRAAARTSK